MFWKSKIKNADLVKFIDAIKLVDEVYVETRKGIPQTQYVIFVSNDPVFDENCEEIIAPLDIQGFWIQEYPDDNTQISWTERIMKTGAHDFTATFVKAKEVSKTIVTYEKE